MKKYISILTGFVLLFSLSFSNALSQESDVYVSLAGGVSIPLGDFAKTDFDDESSGFAKVGGSFNINFGYRFNQYLSLTGLLSGGVNRYDYIELQNWLTNEYAEPLPDTRWVVESKNWGTGGLLAGVTGSLPIVPNRFFIEARALGGFLYTYSPGIYVTGMETGEEDKIINIEQSSAISWALDAGLGLRWVRSRKQYFTLGADYLTSQPHFTDVRTNTNFGFIRDDAYTQNMSTVNITLGIGYIVN